MAESGGGCEVTLHPIFSPSPSLLLETYFCQFYSFKSCVGDAEWGATGVRELHPFEKSLNMPLYLYMVCQYYFPYDVKHELYRLSYFSFEHTVGHITCFSWHFWVLGVICKGYFVCTFVITTVVISLSA